MAERLSDAARRRLAGALLDPQEPEPGKQAGVLEAMMIPGAPVRAILGGLAAAYGIAGAKDIGLFGGDAEAQRGKPKQALPDPPEGLPPAMAKRWQELTARQQRERWLPAAERKELEGINSAVTGAMGAAATAKATGEAEEYSRSVKRAESARDFELSRARRFSDTNIGKVWDMTGGAAPLVGGAVAGALGRAATGGGSALKNYLMPAGEGAVAGITAANIPLGYNAFFTEPDNPERRAYEAYSRELPAGHPRKQESADYAAGLPSRNPVRDEANKEFFDPSQAAKRVIFGAIEGAGGGVMGANAVRVPGAIAEGLAGLPGRLRGAYQKAQPSPVEVAPRPGPAGPPTIEPGPPPVPPRDRARPSQRPQGQPSDLPSAGSYDTSVHTPIAQQYIDDVLASGQPLPSGKEIAAVLTNRFADAGAPAVRQANLTQRANMTSTAINAGADPRGVLGKPGFLAVPGTMIGGEAVLPEELKAALIQQLMQQ